MDRWQFGAAALLAAVASATTGAKAELAFLCEGGRIVYASDATLERLKREDPCVAAHFGQRVPDGIQAVARPVSGGASPTASATGSTRMAAHAGTGEPAAGTESHLQLRPSSASEIVRNPRRATRRRFHEISAETSTATRRSSAPEPLKILNAGSAN